MSTVSRLVLDTEYVRPKITLTDTMQSQPEILKKLQDYTEVEESIDYVTPGSHIRYIINRDNKPLFRLGGFLKMVKPEYIVLSNGKKSWCVQKQNTRFFRKLTQKELSDIELDSKDDIIEQQKQEINRLKRLLR